MLTGADIHTFLLENGIKKSDTVLVHTSMRSLGAVEGGCDGLIDGFISYLADGLFIVPTHTWATVGQDNPIYDVRESAPCIGALPRVAAFRADGVRSLHPTHSVAAFGKRAREFVSGEEYATSPCSEGGVWQRLLDEKAKILLIGVGLNRYTFIHAVDEMLDLPGKLCEPITLTSVGYGGERYALSFKKHGNTGSKYFENYRKPLERLGAMRSAKLGNATVEICDAVRTAEVLRLIWSRAKYDILDGEGEIPEEYYL